MLTNHVGTLHDVVFVLFLRGMVIFIRGQIQAVGCLLVLIGGISISSFSEYKPWTLRDHYSFSGAHTKFSVDVQTAEWKVDVNGLGTVVENAQAEIYLSDGTILRLSEMKFLDTKDYLSECSIEIGDDFIQIISMRYLQGIHIDNPDITRQMRYIFEMLWKCRPEKTRH